MTYKQGSFMDSTTAVATFIATLHPDLIANGWQRVETNLDSGAFRWEVYKNPAANNSEGKDFYIALGRHYPSGTAGSGTVSTSICFTIFELWDTNLKQATNYPVWSAAVNGYTNNYLPVKAVTPRVLPSTTAVLPLTSFVLTSPGAGYQALATATVGVNPPYLGSGATITAVMELDTVAVLAGGSGYPANQSALACNITGGDATAVVTATTNGSGVVTGYTIVNRGANFLSLPTITPDTSGGGSSATTTVRLRVKDFTVSNPGSNYAVNAYPNTGGAGSPSAWATGYFNIDTGFAYGSIALGSTSTQYFYTVTNDMLAFTCRRDGNADAGGWYLGIYEPLQSRDYDPFPLVACYLYGGTTSQVTPYTGYGFFIREPRRSPRGGGDGGLPYDLAAMPQANGNMNNGTGVFNPLPGNSTDGYSGLPLVSRMTVCGRGYYPNWRGILKNVVVSGSNGTNVSGDGIYWTIGATTYFATRVGPNNFIVQV